MARQINEPALLERRNNVIGGGFLFRQCSCFTKLGEVNYRNMEGLVIFCGKSSEKTFCKSGRMNKPGDLARQPHTELTA